MKHKHLEAPHSSLALLTHSSPPPTRPAVPTLWFCVGCCLISYHYDVCVFQQYVVYLYLLLNFIKIIDYILFSRICFFKTLGSYFRDPEGAVVSDLPCFGMSTAGTCPSASHPSRRGRRWWFQVCVLLNYRVSDLSAHDSLSKHGKVP